MVFRRSSELDERWKDRIDDHSSHANCLLVHPYAYVRHREKNVVWMQEGDTDLPRVSGDRGTEEGKCDRDESELSQETQLVGGDSPQPRKSFPEGRRACPHPGLCSPSAGSQGTFAFMLVFQC